MACFFVCVNSRYAFSVILPSFAKINLGLRILGKRPDGYHDLCTIFQTISLQDTLTFQVADELTLSTNIKYLPVDDRNLIIKAGRRLMELTGVKRGAKVHLEKRIPSPGGLGGGSSNAAVALLGFNKLWELGLSIDELHSIGTELGSDVPFFLYGGTAIGTGRGTDIEPVADIPVEHMVLVAPNVRVSTRDAFARLDADCLTSADSASILLNCRFEAEQGDTSKLSLTNDFEKPVFEAHPELGRAKDKLLELGAAKAAMSGSGSGVYGFFDNKETRQTALKALDEEVNWRSFAVAAISRSNYREALEQVY